MESAAEKYEQPPPAYEETVPAEPASPPNERLRLDKSFIRTFLGMNIIANMVGGVMKLYETYSHIGNLDSLYLPTQNSIFQ